MSRIAENNELSPELIALQSLNPSAAYNAPARGVMFSGHFAQRPVVDGSEPPLIQTGVEQEMANHTFGVKMPEDGTILKVIDRYAATIGDDAIPFNPEKLIIYRSSETGQIGCFKIPYHASYSPTFGFKHKHNEKAISQLVAGREFPRDVVFADTPAVQDNLYTYGVNLNIAVMSHPNVGLDGYVISRDVLPLFKFRVYETRTINFGANMVPLNLYGDDDNYRPFPELGDYLREDGLLMALRRFTPSLASATLSKKDLQNVDYLYDQKTYVRAGVGRVVDIKVVKSDNVSRRLPPEMTTQIERYERATQRYYQEISSFERGLVKESHKQGMGGRLNISRRMHRLFVEAKARTNYGAEHQRQNLMLVYRREPLDNWSITFTVEYEITPTRGFKLACENGGKGVICRVEEPENMPVDADGNRAHIITSPDSVPGRMNLGRLYQPYFAGAARDVRKQMLEELGFDRNFVGDVSVEQLKALPQERWNVAVDTLTRLYRIVSFRMWQEFTNELTDDERYEWVADVIRGPHYLYMPIDRDTRDLDDLTHAEMVLEIEKNFKLVYGPVSYVGRSGRRVTTKNKIRIAPIHIMLLDKIADTWLAVDIGKHNNFGILAAMNAPDKYAAPWRRTPPRNFGETEARLYCCYGGREMIAELLDRSGSIATQMETARNILHAEEPTRIDRLIDRGTNSLGNTRPLQMLKHQFFVEGFELIYEPEGKQA